MVDSVKEYNYTKTDDYHVYLYRQQKVTVFDARKVRSSDWKEIPWTKYQIKESDFRVKTGSFTTPTMVDLTAGPLLVKFVSTKHENFMGFVLDDDYTENKDGTYTYKCQDMSRQFVTDYYALIAGGDVTNYRILQTLLTWRLLPVTSKITSEVKSTWNYAWSGLRAKYKYAGSYMGNPISTNMMLNKPKMIIKHERIMDVIRAICYSCGYIDLYFDDNGLLQVKPINLEDWRNTGLHLSVDETSSRQFKFDVTNSISEVYVPSTDDLKIGQWYSGKDTIGLTLGAFFGYSSTYMDNPNKQSSSGSKTTKATKNTNKQTTNTAPVGKNGNPFNNKPKRIIVSADNGSDSFRASIVNLLKKDGWSVTDLGTGSDQHSRSYDILDSKYAVNLTIYNGMCAGTIKECYDGWLKGKHEKYGVSLVMMWDTHSWTDKKGKNNPKGDWYHRNGDMSDYYLAVAHDWGNGGNPTIPDVAAYFKKYKILYCCGTTPANAYAQFKAGGYARMKGLY